jgi:UDPglucose 6-dehydrogenase
MIEKIERHFGGTGNLAGKTFAFWGLSFKPLTDDIREAPALTVVDAMLKAGARVRAHDPVAMENVRAQYGDRITLVDKPYDALDGASALIISTEWQQFRTPDFDEMKKRLMSPVVFDGRNLYKPSSMAQRGFHYYSVGQAPVHPHPAT